MHTEPGIVHSEQAQVFIYRESDLMEQNRICRVEKEETNKQQQCNYDNGNQSSFKLLKNFFVSIVIGMRKIKELEEIETFCGWIHVAPLG